MAVAGHEEASPRSSAARARWLLPVAAPWVWFAVRDLGLFFDAVALVLPVVVLVAVVGHAQFAVFGRSVRAVAVALSWTVFGIAVVVGPWLTQRGPGRRWMAFGWSR